MIQWQEAQTIECTYNQFFFSARGVHGVHTHDADNWEHALPTIAGVTPRGEYRCGTLHFFAGHENWVPKVGFEPATSRCRTGALPIAPTVQGI